MRMWMWGAAWLPRARAQAEGRATFARRAAQPLAASAKHPERGRGAGSAVAGVSGTRSKDVSARSGEYATARASARTQHYKEISDSA
jgi:hypothetical protein